MRVIFISDTHGKHKELDMWLCNPDFNKDCDVIVCSGDTANNVSPHLNLNEQWDFIEWYKELPFEYKIYVPGNHNTSEHMFTNSDYVKAKIIRLIDDEFTLDGLKFYGSPHTPTFGKHWSFNAEPEKIKAMWGLIPTDTDVLVTHGPPFGMLDLGGSLNLGFKGCPHLMDKVLKDIKPRIHAFGHIHDERYIRNNGIRIYNNTMFVNSAVTDNLYKLINPPIIIDI